MIFITSYPYVYERYFRVFDYFPDKKNLTFILPDNWTAKDGAIVASLPSRSDIAIKGVRSYFSHSHYPLIRGLLKGWMPSAKNFIKEHAREGDIVYTAIEPNLLTTWANARHASRKNLKHVFFTWQNVPYRKRLRGLKKMFTEYVVRDTIANSAGAICGNNMAAEIMRTYAPSSFPILVAPISGVDTDRFQPETESSFRKKYGLEDKIMVLFAGVFDERKGIKYILEGFEEAVKILPSLHLVMIGVGPLTPKSSSRITVLPWMANTELPGIFAIADIFLHPSQPVGGWEEQFGYSMAEASASGVPVIATTIGSIPEIVINNVTGVLIKPGESVGISEALVALGNNPDRRKQLGNAGRQHIVKNFSHSVIAKKYFDFFNAI